MGGVENNWSANPTCFQNNDNDMVNILQYIKWGNNSAFIEFYNRGNVTPNIIDNKYIII